MTDYVALIIAYRNSELVRHVLAQLVSQSTAPRLVVIVDNGGTLAEEQLHAWPCSDRTILVSRPNNPGYGAAVNEARDHLGKSALLVLTHDSEFGPELAEQLLGELGADTRIGSVGPLLYRSSDRDRLFSAGGRLTPGGRGIHWDRALSAEPYRVDWLDGAIVMHSAEALEEIGWLAEEYFLYFEDVDTGWRMHAAGFRSLVVPQAIAYQEPGDHPPYLGIRNMTLFARRASIPVLPHLAAVGSRVARESLSRVLRGKAPELVSALRGWIDGRAGMSGKPPHTP
ncbi:glycosyltransferase family 2 protein [Leucobacter sp. W1038]|uniref:glycosyltransferase family 2 protein n=1 Tax=Leucobacter sp. W1038 TaxID=3438281 RepID=UPI003D97D6CE